MNLDLLFNFPYIYRVILAAVAVFLSLGVLAASYITDRDKPQIQALDLHQVNHTISAEKLATWMIENKRDFEILDLRQPEKYEKDHIKNAANCRSCHENKKQALSDGTYIPNFNKKIIVYTETGEEEVYLPRVLINRANVLHLEGGFQAWQREILEPGENPEKLQELDPEKRALIMAISNYFLGKTDIAAPPKVEVQAKRNVHVLPSFGNQGC